MNAKEAAIIDLSRFPSPESAGYELLSPEEFDELDLYSTFTLEATTKPTGQWFLSELACEKEIGFYGDDWCDGDVELIRYDLPKEIWWRCKKCGDNGKIINFEHTFWDFSNLPEEEKGRRSKILGDQDVEDDLDTMDILENMSEEDTMDLLGVLDQYMKGIGSDMSRELGGLNSQQVYRILSGDWTQPDNMIYLRDDLTLEAVDQSLFLHNARAFLNLLKDEGKFGSTKELGNLNRKSVARLIDVCRWPDGYLEEIRKMNKAIDEDDVWLLKNIRVLLDLAGLIHKKKGAFYLTKKNSDLIEKSQAGRLYRRLFSTMFKKMNLAFLAGSDYELPSLQDSTPYILFRLKQEAKKWISSNKLAERILLATAYQELDLTSMYNTVGDELYYYMLNPLEYFGLVESRYSGGQPDFFSSPPNEFRITSLFDRFITFNVDNTEPAGNVIPISDISKNIPASKKKKGKPGQGKNKSGKIYQLRISLDYIEPEIWRRVLIPSGTLLPDLHKIIQTCMGWENGHLHQFKKDRTRYGTSSDMWEGTHDVDYRNVRVDDLLTRKRSRIVYEYDFGDSWTHEILVEDTFIADPKVKYPVCVDGARHCPPEDCGGFWGYEDMLETLADPENEEYDDLMEWLEEDFNPEYFDKDAVNARLKQKDYGCQTWY